MTVNYLPAISTMEATVLENLRAARQEVGSGGGTGETFMKLNDENKLVFGAEQNPWPVDMRCVVGLHSFQHGYIDWQEKKPKERNIIPMMQGARPTPPGGSVTKLPDGTIHTLKAGEYGSYDGGGPRDITEIVLNSIDEPGFRVTFTAMSGSSANRVGDLLEVALVHTESPDGKAGFVHPVILAKPGSYMNKRWGKRIYHWDFEIVDWLHNDGKRLLSQEASVGSIKDTKDAAAEPTTVDLEDDDLTPQERELLRA